MRGLLCFSAALALTASSLVSRPAFAQESPVPRPASREDSRFEGQGRVTLDWFRQNHVFNNGIFTAGYQVIARPSDLGASGDVSGLGNPISHRIVVDVETRLWAGCLQPNLVMNDRSRCATSGDSRWNESAQRYDTSPGTEEGAAQEYVQILPFEMTLSMQANDAQFVSVDRIRAGIARIIWQSLGLTLQLGSYSMRTYPHGLGVRHGGELANFVVNEVVRLDRAGNVELVVRGSIGGGVGGFHAQNPTFRAAEQRVGWNNGSLYNVNFFGDVSASVGLRFFNRALFEVFGGASGNLGANGCSVAFNQDLNYRDYNTNGLREGQTWTGQNCVVSRTLTQTQLGAQLRFRFNDNFHLRLVGSWNHYELTGELRRQTETWVGGPRTANGGAGTPSPQSRTDLSESPHNTVNDFTGMLVGELRW